MAKRQNFARLTFNSTGSGKVPGNVLNLQEDWATILFSYRQQCVQTHNAMLP